MPTRRWPSRVPGPSPGSPGTPRRNPHGPHQLRRHASDPRRRAVGAGRASAASRPESTSTTTPPGDEADKADPGVWLIVQWVGRKVVRSRSAARPSSSAATGIASFGSARPMVSKIHAAIERREGRTFLKDLGSTNGTVFNGRVLRSQEAEIHDGDRIQIGPVVATLAIVAQREGGAKVEEQVAEWLHGDVPSFSARSRSMRWRPPSSPPPATVDAEAGPKSRSSRRSSRTSW